MARLYDADNNVKPIANLGWIMRNHRLVESFVVTGGTAVGHDATLIAQLSDGRRYECEFASADILFWWLHRPRFYGLPLKWYGFDSTIANVNLARQHGLV